MLKYFTVILISFFLASCAGSSNKSPEKSFADSTGIQAGERTTAPFLPSVVDSFEVVYYKKPFIDSSRYYRFFRVAITSDSSFIREMNLVMTGAYDKLSEVKKCLSEGKLVIPLGGEAYRTVYFSRVETGCPYLYYIKDGAFYYYEITPVLNEKLNILEKLAIEPN